MERSAKPMAAPTGRDCSRVLSVLSGKRQKFTVRPADMPPRRPALNALCFAIFGFVLLLSDLTVALAPALATDLSFVAILLRIFGFFVGPPRVTQRPPTIDRPVPRPLYELALSCAPPGIVKAAR